MANSLAYEARINAINTTSGTAGTANSVEKLRDELSYYENHPKNIRTRT